MKLNSKSALMGIVLLLILGLGYAYWTGEKENKQYRIDYEMYSFAVQLIMEEQEGNKALPQLIELDKKYPDNEYISLYSGYAYAYLGDFKNASMSIQNSYELNPLFQLNPDYNLNFADILMVNKEYSKAKWLLDKTAQLPGADKQKIEELNAVISQKNK